MQLDPSFSLRQHTNLYTHQDPPGIDSAPQQHHSSMLAQAFIHHPQYRAVHGNAPLILALPPEPAPPPFIPPSISPPKPQHSATHSTPVRKLPLLPRHACPECSATFNSKREQADHLSYDHFIWNSWICAECAAAFDMEFSLMQHYTLTHPAKIRNIVNKHVVSIPTEVTPLPPCSTIAPSLPIKTAKRKRDETTSVVPSCNAQQAATPRATNNMLTPSPLKARRVSISPRGGADPYGLRGKFYKKPVNRCLEVRRASNGNPVVDLTSPVKEKAQADEECDDLERALMEAWEEI